MQVQAQVRAQVQAWVQAQSSAIITDVDVAVTTTEPNEQPLASILEQPVGSAQIGLLYETARSRDPRLAATPLYEESLLLSARPGHPFVAEGPIPLTRLADATLVFYDRSSDDYEATQSMLRQAGVIDEDLGWAGARTHLVIVGDVLDRGPDSRDAMDLLMRLEVEAESAGGMVHVLVGNHEAMNLVGDLRYVAKEEFSAFAGEETGEERARWLAEFETAWIRLRG